MSSLLQKLKDKVAIAPTQNQTVIQIPSDAKQFVCKNHFTMNNKGKQVIVRVILQFLPNEKMRTCECGIVYKRV